MRRRLRKAAPYVAPPDAPPLRDVVLALGQQTARLNLLDDQISTCITTLERRLHERKFERIISVRLPDGADLGWSYGRQARRWRFVIRTQDDAWELQSCSRAERAEVFSCGAMGRLIAMVPP